MREILFRGKRKRDCEWLEGVFMPENDVDPAMIFYGRRHSCGEYVDPATVGQYIGLTDMQDVKIFEGDIVQFGGEYGKIEYSETEAMFQVVFDSWLTDFDHLRGTEVEVVGNIHDNPELLEG